MNLFCQIYQISLTLHDGSILRHINIHDRVIYEQPSLESRNPLFKSYTSIYMSCDFRRRWTMMTSGILVRRPGSVWCWWPQGVRTTLCPTSCPLSKTTFTIRTGDSEMQPSWHLVGCDFLWVESKAFVTSFSRKDVKNIKFNLIWLPCVIRFHTRRSRPCEAEANSGTSHADADWAVEGCKCCG